MNEDHIKSLKRMKQQINGGTYRILGKRLWDKHAEDLGNYGAVLLQDIETIRDKICKIKIHLFFFKTRGILQNLICEHENVIRDYNLFFDVGMRFLKSLTEGTKCDERQYHTQKYLEKLVEHCNKSANYLNDLISSRRSEYFNCQTLFWVLVAIIIAVISMIISIVKWCL